MTQPADLPKTFRRIDLALAREPGHPNGDPTERYVIIAPLLPDGRIDGDEWRAHRDACRVVRSHAGDTLVGKLVHGPGGQWKFHYGDSSGIEDETGYRFAEEKLQAGEYLSILRDDGAHPYQVTAVTSL